MEFKPTNLRVIEINAIAHSLALRQFPTYILEGNHACNHLGTTAKKGPGVISTVA